MFGVANLEYTTNTKLISFKSFELNLFTVMEPPTVLRLLFVSSYIFIWESCCECVLCAQLNSDTAAVFGIVVQKESYNIISFSPLLLYIAFHFCLGLTQNLLTSLFPILSASSNAMTQQLQDEFDSSVENAEAWMKAIQERLRINDNTKGPRSALEARLRETEVREERWNSEVALTAAIVTAVIAVNSRVFQ